jgi:4-hydroxybenzoate polyprenyltransferase
MPLLHLIKLARPEHWLKNAFVFVALIFSGSIFSLDPFLHTLIAFACFCMASSAVYFLNDYKDLAADAVHPVKRRRPLASGALPPMTGPVGFAVLCTAAIAISMHFLCILSTAILVLYLALNIVYSLGLKRLVIVDVLIIAAGFVLRILAGAAAIRVMPSRWLVLCTITISLFLGFTKRRSEVLQLGENGVSHRSVLQHYSTTFLDQMISVVTAATVVFYILYTVDSATVTMVGSSMLILTVPLVLYGIFRYLYLVYHTRNADDPTRTIFADVPMMVTGAIWTAMCAVIILYGKDLLTIINGML